MKVVDCARMAGIDRRAQRDYRIPQTVLMEDAGLGAFRLLREVVWAERPPEGEILFLAGTGNNGGDALVMARRARLEGTGPQAIVLGAGTPESGSLAAAHLEICAALGIEVLDWSRDRAAVRRRIGRAACLVDGLLGTGVKGPARAAVAELITLANRSAAQRVAVDLPSGLGDGFRPGFPALRADWTLTIGLPKLCLYLPGARALCGRILVVPGVFPSPLLEDPTVPGDLIEPERAAALLPAVPRDTHKGGRGHLAVFAGAPGTTGAAWLAATAAARSRAGLVTVFVDASLYAACVPAFRSVMLRPLSEAETPPGSRGGKRLPELGRFDALLVGPGWGTGAPRQELLLALLRSGLPGVLDADGITILAGLRPARLPKLGGKWVLTPHPGEMARLAGIAVDTLLADPLPTLLSASAELQAVIVLKGHCTLVASPDGRYGLLDGMNPALATGGSGDVLAGIVGGLIAGGMPAWEAARAGVGLHALVGQELFRVRGFFLAEDMVERVSRAVKGPPRGPGGPGGR